VRSVVAGGRLILNTAFPRALLPLSSVITAFMRFLPTIIIYIPLHFLSDRPITWQLLWAIPIFALLILIAAGLTMFIAAAQVYFRDLRNFLPYILRVWLYATPILYYANEVPDRYQPLITFNPIGKLLSAWTDVINRGLAPKPTDLLIGLAWAVVVFIGGALFFMSREREFAVRL
jgi:teichoic acid transport system permease protein